MIKDTIFVLSPSFWQIFSNNGWTRYKNTTPPIPNLIDGIKDILFWKVILYSSYVHGT